MCRKFAVMLLTATILFRVACELFEPNYSDNYSNLYSFVEKWAMTSYTKVLTVVFDDYEYHRAFDIPRGILVSLNVSTKLVSLKHVMSLKYKNMRRDYQTIDTESCVLLLFSNVDHLRDILSSPHLMSFWHPENFYILQEQGLQFSDSSVYERFCKWAFERLWRFRRVYKLLLFAADKVIRYDPFDYAARQTGYSVNTSCDWNCVKSNRDGFLLISGPNTTDISDFFIKDRRDFKLSPLEISIFETSTISFQNGQFSGLDFKYLEEVCKMMNVTFVLIRSKDRFGWEENGVFFGTIGHLVYKFADVSFNHFFIKDYFTRELEFTTPITSDKLCVLVPKAPPIPDYLVIVKIFTGGAWLLVFVTHFVISMIYTIFKNERFEAIRRGGTVFFCCEYPTGFYFLENRNGGVVKIAPKFTKKQTYGEAHGIYLVEKTPNVRSMIKTKKGRSKRFNEMCLSFVTWLTKVVFQLMQPFKLGQAWFPERLLMMCSLFLSLILNGLITSQLASSFSKRMYYENINTLEQLKESGLTILTDTRDILDDALTDIASPIIKELNDRLEYANKSEVYRRLFKAKDAGYLHRLETLPFKYSAEEMETLHVVSECPKEYILANIITKGSPYGGRINSILARLNNGGFYGKWYQSIHQSQKRPTLVLNGSTMHRKITIRHLFIPFGILYIGLAMSIIVFIYEYQQNNVR
ncbi:uncharacterized protein LOC112213251 isoform X1 [Bombus impatiens]|uniref:Uncharacterized protein LOC112213251 isoform X1 n=1 Tax=Bombus impatiens TaxID=132113 RepID=A0A6P8LTD2_BOMIM|nr:uncharacterized protein LOC112213251 isoform X1 [Bombus impatiens]